MKNNYYINYMDYYIPNTQYSADYILKNISQERKNEIKNFDNYITKFLNETKIETIAYFEDKREFSRKIYELIEKMLKNVNITAKDISYILCGNPHLFNMDGVSIIHSLKNDFNFSNSIILPIMQPCAATLCGISISEKLLENEKYILIVSGCCWNSIDERYIDFSIRGDGISIMLLSQNEGKFCVKDSNVLNYNNSILNVDGSLKYDEPTLSRINLICTGSNFVADSIKKFGVDVSNLSKIIQPNPGYYVFHNLYSYYAKLDSDIFFYDNIPNGGHICDIDIVRNLMDFDKKRKLKPGEKVMLYTPDVEPTFDINYYSVLLEKC